MMNDLSARQAEIASLARSAGRIGVEDLARRYGVSAQTIRKDLNELCDRRLLTRVHGGAIVSSGVENIAYEARRLVAAAEKRAIGVAAATLIPNSSSLFINIGTTTEEVAKALAAHEDLLVITNNINVAMLLYKQPRMEVIVAGGTLRRSDGAVVGASASELIRQFKVDHAVIGASAIEADGTLLDFDYREVQVAQAILENSRHAILVADSSKLERSAPVRIAHIGQVQTWVTDDARDSPVRDVCRERGVAIVEALPHGDVDEDPEARRD
jgi:DeoR family transcriptional regulator, glycerol-3-phosphate regulon repressor